MKKRIKFAIALSCLAASFAIGALLCACNGKQKAGLVSVTFRAYGTEDVVMRTRAGGGVTPPAVPEIENNIGHWDLEDFDYFTEDTVVNAVYETEGLGFRLLDDNSYEVSDNSTDLTTEQLFIPAEHEGSPVTQIADYGFAVGNRLPNGSYYELPRKIKAVHLPATIERIGEWAFNHLSDLEQVTWENAGRKGGFATVGSFAFYFCGALKSFDSENVIELEMGAFAACGLTAFDMKNISDIPSMAFDHCPLVEIDLRNVISIGSGAFRYAENLQRVEFPKKLKQLDDYAFMHCTALKEVVFEAGSELEYIGQQCFEQTAITKIEVPVSVQTIGMFAFEGCISLRTVILPEEPKFTSLVSALFANDYALETFTIPSTIESIKANAFMGCTGISSITVPAGVKEMGENAFAKWTSEQTIYVEGRSQKPEDWPDNWCGNATVIWLGA